MARHARTLAGQPVPRAALQHSYKFYSQINQPAGGKIGNSITSSGHTAAADEGFFAQYIITAQRRLILALECSLVIPKPWAQFWPLLSEILGLFQGLTSQHGLCWIAPCSRKVASSPVQGWSLTSWHKNRSACKHRSLRKGSVMILITFSSPAITRESWFACLFPDVPIWLQGELSKINYLLRNTTACCIIFFCYWMKKFFF